MAINLMEEMTHNWRGKGYPIPKIFDTDCYFGIAVAVDYA